MYRYVFMMDSECPVHVQSHQGHRSSLIHSVVSNDSVADSGLDQTAWMCRLIWAFAVCLCPKMFSIGAVQKRC